MNLVGEGVVQSGAEWSLEVSLPPQLLGGRGRLWMAMYMVSSLWPPMLPHDPARRPRCPFTAAIACQVEIE